MENLIEEIEKYFSDNGNKIITKEKVTISKAGGAFCLEYLLEDKDEERFTKYELYDEVDLKDFIQEYQLGNISDLKLISRSQIWLRYLREKAEVVMTNGDENQVKFRLFRGITTVYSRDLNYYTEVYKMLNMTDHFKAFVNENLDLIEGMSYKK